MEILDDNHCFVCGELNVSGLRMRPRIDAEAKAKMFDVTGEKGEKINDDPDHHSL